MTMPHKKKKSKKLYYIQPDGTWSCTGDRRSKGVLYKDLPPNAEISSFSSVTNEIVKGTLELHQRSPFKSYKDLKQHIKVATAAVPPHRLMGNPGKSLVNEVLKKLTPKIIFVHSRSDIRKFADYDKKLSFIIADATARAFPDKDPLNEIAVKADRLAQVMKVEFGQDGLTPFLDRAVRLINPRYKTFKQYLSGTWQATANDMDPTSLAAFGISRAMNPWN